MNLFKEVSGQGKDIVILHGWGGCNHKHMQPVVDQLSARYRVTNFDLPGQGKSDWHADIQTIHDIADQLVPYLPKHAIYIGWSFGGLVAMSIAARHSEHVSHLIGIATTPKFIADENWPGVPQPGFKSSFASEIKLKGLKVFMQAWYDSEFIDFNAKPAAYHELITMLDQDALDVNLDILSKGVDICDATDLRKEFKTLSCSIDLILSEQDNAIPTISFEKIKELNQKVNIHVVPNAHHLPFWTHSHEFNTILNSIL